MADNDDGRVGRFSFQGDYDAFNLPTVSKEIDDLIESGCTRLVLNLKELKFINSSAIGYLIKTAKRLKVLEGELVLAEPSQFFKTTVETLGIDQIFRIFPSDSAAIDYFGEA